MRIRLDDMRMFAALAEAASFTAAARGLGVPKQTLSRRIAELERGLGAVLVARTTRSLRLTPAGARYAARCAEVVRIADDANRALVDADEREVPRGTLRITADPVFGEAFLPPVLHAFAARWPAVALEVLLTQRRVDLIEEGFDAAFRIGHVDDPSLTAILLGPARVRYCASPAYVRRRGRPTAPEDLARHDCLVVRPDLAPAHWPFRDERGAVRSIAVAGRLRCNSHALARAAALAGLGVAIFPEFASAEDLRAKRLVSLLDDWRIDAGAVWLVHPSQRLASARVERFVALALEHLRAAPWARQG
ncbi:MAG TPA: LysR substrate-binding domain-containing protein [Kofleriaceae bacterium]|nr:LysR substrate-binding domain-containing protein [Kofleriaceae bacterium]